MLFISDQRNDFSSFQIDNYIKKMYIAVAILFIQFLFERMNSDFFGK